MVPEDSTKARWSILRNTLLNRRSGASVAKDHEKVTRRPVGRFGLVQIERAEAESSEIFEVLNYKLFNGKTISLRQRREEAFVLEDLRVANDNKIDNTGVICLWPAEEVLTHYCTVNAEQFRGCRVLELG
eukprot:CAMPEP_0118925986 /NCGR_PEP_ID=MMETSP1169-20130426/3782_1 /TAXON_ID=36882 /ORGANISM="Pyramimonas obovata, Strain CCMP722" /LENGTH=129 /DNA_ID=CAMNT_0006867439 /DNA_START=214 /DNA_END=599 /DNA_ORIENTATION=-